MNLTLPSNSLNRSIFVIGYPRLEGPQMWTGDFTVMPVTVTTETGQEAQLVAAPIWTYLPLRALKFASAAFAKEAIKKYNAQFNWISTIRVVDLRYPMSGQIAV